MSISQTRDLLINVARQLFAKIGFQETTMNDIAVASQKGRRTLYTYFKNKQEVYNAVIANEVCFLTEQLEGVLEMTVDADVKLRRFFHVRMDSIKQVVQRNGNLRADFFKDVNQVATVRRNLSQVEFEVIRTILREGKEAGVFRIDNVDATTLFIQYALQGMDVPFIKGFINEKGIYRRDLEHSIFNLVFNGILNKEHASR